MKNLKISVHFIFHRKETASSRAITLKIREFYEYNLGSSILTISDFFIHRIGSSIYMLVPKMETIIIKTIK